MTGNNLRSKFLMAIKPAKKRAVAEVISSLLLVVITVVGAVILTTFLDETFVAGSSSLAGSDISTRSLQLLKYDTRDSVNLLLIGNLDNNFGDDILLGDGLIAGNEDKIPEDGGTEFLVMQIENRGINSVFLEDVSLNGVKHDWDSDTADRILDADGTDFTGLYPKDGKFSISLIPPDPLNDPYNQKLSAEIEEGQTVNLVVKLGTDVTDIDLNKSIRVLLNIGTVSPVEFIIESGDAK